MKSGQNIRYKKPEIIFIALLDEWLILLNKAEYAESEKEKQHCLELLQNKLQGLQDMLKNQNN